MTVIAKRSRVNVHDVSPDPHLVLVGPSYRRDTDRKATTPSDIPVWNMSTSALHGRMETNNYISSNVSHLVIF